MQPLLLERVKVTRSVFPNIEYIDGSRRWLRVRTPNYDSLAYSLVYCTNREFRRNDTDKKSSINNLIKQMRDDGSDARSPLEERSLDSLARYFGVQITLLEMSNGTWNYTVHGVSSTRVYILKASTMHFEPIAFFNYQQQEYEFVKNV